MLPVWILSDITITILFFILILYNIQIKSYLKNLSCFECKFDVKLCVNYIFGGIVKGLQGIPTYTYIYWSKIKFCNLRL